MTFSYHVQHKMQFKPLGFSSSKSLAVIGNNLIYFQNAYCIRMLYLNNVPGVGK